MGDSQAEKNGPPLTGLEAYDRWRIQEDPVSFWEELRAFVLAEYGVDWPSCKVDDPPARSGG